MTREAAETILEIFTSPTAVESHVTTDASISSQARILTNDLIGRMQLLFRRAARGLSESMVGEVTHNAETGVRRSLKDVSAAVTLTGSLAATPELREITKASVVESVSLIKSIPEKYLKSVQGAVMRAITTGNGLQDLTPYLTKSIASSEASVARSRMNPAKEIERVERAAKNMALDQTRKVYNTVNKERMIAAGVGSFEWVHSGGGQKPRQKHIDMSGNIYKFDDLPVIDDITGERGIPGQLPNCRCTMAPVVDFGED